MLLDGFYGVYVHTTSSGHNKLQTAGAVLISPTVSETHTHTHKSNLFIKLYLQITVKA